MPEISRSNPRSAQDISKHTSSQIKKIILHNKNADIYDLVNVVQSRPLIFNFSEEIVGFKACSESSHSLFPFIKYIEEHMWGRNMERLANKEEKNIFTFMREHFMSVTVMKWERGHECECKNRKKKASRVLKNFHYMCKCHFSVNATDIFLLSRLEICTHPRWVKN